MQIILKYSNSLCFSYWVFFVTFQEEEILALYNEMAPVEPFLFYHSKNGRTSTFESVAFPGWFIASSERSHPIFLTSHQGGIYNVNFNLNINA